MQQLGTWKRWEENQRCLWQTRDIETRRSEKPVARGKGKETVYGMLSDLM